MLDGITGHKVKYSPYDKSFYIENEKNIFIKNFMIDVQDIDNLFLMQVNVGK